MRRATTRWPALLASSTSVAPDLSSASVRVSETVRIATLTGRKGRLSSIRGIGATLPAEGILSGIGGPVAGRKRVEVGSPLPQAHAVDPVVREHALHVAVRLLVGDALDEEQRIVLDVVGREPFRDRAGAGVIGGGYQQQIV